MLRWLALVSGGTVHTGRDAALGWDAGTGMIPDDVLRAVDYAVLGVSGVRVHARTAAALAALLLMTELCCLFSPRT